MLVYNVTIQLYINFHELKQFVEKQRINIFKKFGLEIAILIFIKTIEYDFKF